MNKNERITICVDSESKERFRILAEKSGVSMSALGRVMLNIGDLIEKTIKESIGSLKIPSIEVVQETEETIWVHQKKKVIKSTVVGGYAKKINSPLLNEIRNNDIYKKQKEKHNKEPISNPTLRPPPGLQILNPLVAKT